MAGSLDMSTVFELVGGVANSIKREEGKEGLSGVSVDPKKLGLVLLSFGGRQFFGYLMARRQKKSENLEEALELLRERAGIKPPRKTKSPFPFAFIGFVVGAGIYLSTLKKEERNQIISGVDNIVTGVVGLINSIQGK